MFKLHRGRRATKNTEKWPEKYKRIHVKMGVRG